MFFPCFFFMWKSRPTILHRNAVMLKLKMSGRRNKNVSHYFHYRFLFTHRHTHTHTHMQSHSHTPPCSLFELQDSCVNLKRR